MWKGLLEGLMADWLKCQISSKPKHIFKKISMAYLFGWHFGEKYIYIKHTTISL